MLLSATALFLIPPPPKADHSPKFYKPQFHINQCFISNRMPREPWQPPVDGIIAMVGYSHYLVMFYEEANKRTAGGKDGWQEDMQDFDKKYHVTTCPASWEHKEGKKP